MKKIFQTFKNGKIFIEDVPVPSISDDEILVRSELSLISSGTEKMLLDFGKSNYLSKAIDQPDKFNKALKKLKTDGIYSTYDSIKSKLD